MALTVSKTLGAVGSPSFVSPLTAIPLEAACSHPTICGQLSSRWAAFTTSRRACSREPNETPEAVRTALGRLSSASQEAKARLLARTKDLRVTELLLERLRLEEAQITEVGRLLSTGDHQLRVDAVVEGDGQEWWVRCLARGEALYPQERVLWPGMVASMGPDQRLAIVRQGPLYPGDQALLDELPADRVINQQL